MILVICIIYAIVAIVGAFKIGESRKIGIEKSYRGSKEKVIFKAEFSNKPYNMHLTFAMLSILFGGVVYFFSYKEMIMEEFDWEEVKYVFVYTLIWFGFLVTALYNICSNLLAIGVCKEYLIITDEKIYGLCCIKENIFNYTAMEFQIKISDVEEIMALKGESDLLWIGNEKLTIVTKSNKFEMLHILDGHEIKRVIEKRMAENIETSKEN